MLRQHAYESIRGARANIHLAAQICAAADFASLRQSIDLLEAAADAVRQAEDEVRAGVPRDPAEIRRQILLLKQEIASLMRVIDGCASVCRGLSLRLSGNAIAYTPQGRESALVPSAAACEVQG
ncbi:hypothetical protein SBA3_1010033 [Candidatus Sulfopaludibacter sp. SbA3]|nr:hypothetical protein SBA3_1010033 [Candidatus Sulfopaludibacter sp. SbA3]